MIEEHSSVVLTEPLPAAGLEAGDVGVVVHVHRDGEAFEVEFMTLDGNTLTVETLTTKQIRAPAIAISRTFASAPLICLTELETPWRTAPDSNG